MYYSRYIITWAFQYINYRSYVCENCWGRLELSSQVCCPACGLVRYCGEECRRKGEEEHGEECHQIRKEKGLSDELRLIVKIWRKIRKEGEQRRETQGGISRCWEDLMDHVEEMMEDKADLLTAEYHQLMVVMNEDEIPPWNTFLSIYGKVLTNCFSLRSDR